MRFAGSGLNECHGYPMRSSKAPRSLLIRDCIYKIFSCHLDLLRTAIHCLFRNKISIFCRGCVSY